MEKNKQPGHTINRSIKYENALRFLSYRELQILHLVSVGLKNSEIAHHLNIAIATVKTHRKNICKKLGLKGQNKLLLWALTEVPKDEYSRYL